LGIAEVTKTVPLRPLLPFPALLIETTKKVLVLADLHIGWEWDARFLQAGLYIPSQTPKLQEKLMKLIEEHRPDTLLLLGDVKQAITRMSIEDWRVIPEFFENIQSHVDEIIVVLGNHDGELEPLTPPTVTIVPSRGLTIGQNPQIGLLHGHAWPSPEVLSSDILIMGHLHPVVWFRDKLGIWTVRQVWVVSNCDSEKLAIAYLKYLNVTPTTKPREVLLTKTGVKINDPKLIIVPAFNDLVGGVSVHNLTRRLMGPIIRSTSVDIDTAEIYLLDGTYLGDPKHLQNQLITDSKKGKFDD
jgi:putative SbcD/Mre11-related phosphoesterase